MGFGSYDETEQENQNVDANNADNEAVEVHETDHDGEVSFESEASTEALVDRLDEMKDDGDED